LLAFVFNPSEIACASVNGYRNAVLVEHNGGGKTYNLQIASRLHCEASLLCRYILSVFSDVAHVRLLMLAEFGNYEETLPDIDGDGIDAAVWFDVELINQSNKQVVGTATDCLSDRGSQSLPLSEGS
jgi:hypothetical protein